jgi:hypothetical protein
MEDRVVASNRVDRLENLILKEIENTSSKQVDGAD